MSVHAQARTSSRRRPRSRRRLGRRRLALLATVVLATIAATAVLSPWADKAVKEVTLPLRHDDVIRQQAADKRLDPALIAGVIYVESRFRDQTSHAGAKGLMQLMPGTADYIATKSGGTEFEQGDLADAADQHLLRLLVPALPAGEVPRQRHPHPRRLQRRRGQGRPVVAGGGRPRGALPRGRPHPVPETREYVSKVLDARRAYRREYARELGL